MPAPAAPARTDAAAPREPTPTAVPVLRADLQGLRCVAVLAVVLYHLWPGAVPGGYVGVDVFFVVSGYLITAHLLRRPPRTAGDLAAFWARRVRRLLPASLLVLAVTVAATRLVAPPLTWAATAREVTASALYVENWALAAAEADYLGAGAEPTAVRHFWSLAVEEQFYLGWPLLLLGAFALAGRRRWRPRPTAVVVVGAVAVVSFAWSVHLTTTDPAAAYLVTPARIWELAVGGLVAAAGGGAVTRWGPGVRAAVAWAGTAAVVASAVLFTATTAFPGPAALLPVLGTAAVVVAAAQGPGTPGVLWRLPGVQWLGGASYSVYLWHWPLVVLTPHATGGRFATAEKVAVLLLTLALSALSKPWVEDRFRRTRGRPVHVFGRAAAGTVVVLSLAGLLAAQAGQQEQQARAQLEERVQAPVGCLGAAAVARGPQNCPPDREADPVPAPALAPRDRPDAYADGCFSTAPYDRRPTCTYGSGPTRVALVGNSHAGQWLPAVQRLAAERGWTVTTYLLSLCAVSTARPALADPGQADNCQAYGRWARDAVAAGGYDLVVTSNRQSLLVEGEDWPGTERAAARAHERMLRAWSASGADVVVVRDPVVPGDAVGRVPECLAAADGDAGRCSWPFAPPVPADPSQYRWTDPLSAAARSLDDPRVATVALDDLLCPGGTCRPVLGGVVTYSDASHLTATYAATLAPYLGERIDRALRAP